MHVEEVEMDFSFTLFRLWTAPGAETESKKCLQYNKHTFISNKNSFALYKKITKLDGGLEMANKVQNTNSSNLSSLTLLF